MYLRHFFVLVIIAFTIAVLNAPQSLAACTNPAGVAGQTLFNADYNVLQYCDDTNWIAMVGAETEPNAPTTGLVGHWRMDEIAGTIVKDYSGQGRDGTHTNATPSWNASGGKIDGALEFIPSADTVDAGTWEVGGTGGITMAAWVYADTVTNSGRRIISKAGGATGPEHSWMLRLQGAGNQSFGVRLTTVNGFEEHDAVNGTYPSSYLGAWHHLAATYDESDGSIVYYVDGVQVDTDTHSLGGALDTTSSNPIGIGNQASTASGSAVTSRSMDGFLDDVRVYNRPLSATEMQQLHRATASKYTQIVPSGLVGHWRLDETSGTTAYDSSGNGNDGTRSGDEINFSGDSVRGAIGNALDFGVTETCCLADIIEFTSGTGFPTGAGAEFSLSFWAFGQRENTGLLFAYGDTDPYGSAVDSWVSAAQWAGELRVETDNGRMDFNALANGDPWSMEGRWSHFTITQSATEIRVYTNGDELTPSYTDFGYPYTNVIDPESAFLRLGNIDTAWNGEATVIMDDVRFYNRAITAAEVQEIYEARDGIQYDEAHNVPEYFDGNRWVSMAVAWPEVTDGLVGHWKLDETSGTTAYDSSGNGNDGAMTGSLSADSYSKPGAVGRAIQMNSNDQGIIQTPDTWVAQHVDESFSIAMWLNISSASTKQTFTYDVWGTDDGTGATGVRYGVGGAGARDFTFIIEDVGSLSTTSDPINYDEWQHVAFVRDSSGPTKIYVDGVIEVDSDLGAGNSSFASNQDRLKFGDGANGNHQFLGMMDDVLLYDRVLSAAEIQKLYRMGAPVGQTTSLPQGCPNIGDVCDDGTFYAGLSPDGNVLMFVAPEDAPGGPIYPWNNDNTSGYVTTNLTSNNDGDGQTLTLVISDSDSVTAGFQTHAAAQYCYDLIAAGSDDWYLPANTELRDIFDSGFHAKFGMLTGSVGDGSTSYWSSTEFGNSSARRRNSSGSGINTKENDYNVRCVRKGPAPRCVNPYGLEGAMLYNGDHNVLQYCDGARWLAIGKAAP